MQTASALAISRAGRSAGLIAFCLMIVGNTVSAGSIETAAMKAPKTVQLVHPLPKPADAQGNSLQAVLLGSVHFFQKWISPVDGPRCNFSPTCSRFGYQAVEHHGPALGIILTADRLMRCNVWTTAGPDYPLLSNGALHDPVDHNLLSSP
jgi:putative membrane protein insertion efficiency factor